MSFPPVLAIHADFPSRAGWHVDPVTGYCFYQGLTILWCRDPGAGHIGFPVTLPMVFSFFLPTHAEHVGPRSPGSPQVPYPQAGEPMETGEPIPAVPVTVVSPPGSPDQRVPQTQESMGSPPPRRNLSCFRVTARKRVRSPRFSRDARIYRRRFRRGEASGVRESEQGPTAEPGSVPAASGGVSEEDPEEEDPRG